MKKLTAIALASLSLFMGAIQANDDLDDIATTKGPNSVGIEAISPSGATYNVTVTPGSNQCFTSVLSSTSDRDTVNVVFAQSAKPHIYIEDCCITGDTICMFAGKRSFCVTSPETLDKTFKKQMSGKKTFKIGYNDVPGGFPAGYTFCVGGE